ncbi:transcriptional regulator, Crp/Fnr family [Janthinobacterium sp. HH01]|uniref:Crp/Fnr family transcriptional regulator n=1 Tax=Janthinobacterium sp. HH01 TaxID=1198452 RepID=UPI0002AEB187|nr:Crp/Fnr family transcriptional regulator [Janthinobacterium sp. HH01]ELX08490.1 transcriptional regulator, Crp/Fnr family [Janthinobacterium sp. HH01]
MNSTQLKATPGSTISLIGAQQNDLLRALSREDLIALFGDLELVTLPAGKHLFDFGDQVEYSYFPTNAIVSLQYVMEDGASTEIAVVGSEGVVGVALYPAERASYSAVVQCAGYGYRLRTDVLREAFYSGGPLAQLLMRYTSAMFAQLAQSVAGSRHTSIEQKLCRWLLERLDRSTTNELKVTQEMIANMLGVRRESITGAAGKLSEEGLIAYRRGCVTVLNRDLMERRAGSCYQAARSGATTAMQYAA